jgi:hypothetical protein
MVLYTPTKVPGPTGTQCLQFFRSKNCVKNCDKTIVCAGLENYYREMTCNFQVIIRKYEECVFGLSDFLKKKQELNLIFFLFFFKQTQMD